MAYVHHYDHVFDAPLSKRAKPRKISSVFCNPDDPALSELEFSNYGRNPRFPAGWFILPAMVFGMAIIAAVIVLV
ncbi:MAG TPA: hypothetical protein VGM26_00205 [Rhizomicrobium sp.]|jgi:hypothetical protein